MVADDRPHEVQDDELPDSGELALDSARTDDGEVIEVFTATLDELHGWIRAGTVTDVKTIVGAYWLEQHLAGNWPAR